MFNFAKKILESQIGETQLFWVGQAGYIIKSPNGKLLGIDLYLSECVEPIEGHVGYHRLMPQILDYNELQFDILISTHFHRDHFDIDAMPQLMDNGKTILYCAYDCQNDIERLHIDKQRVQFVKAGEHYEHSGFKLDFISSDHGASAPLEVAPIITVNEKRILEVGDTSLHLDWKDEYLKMGQIDVLIAPINGAYGNLNEKENVLLTKTLQPKLIIPCHFGMFSSHGGNPDLWMKILNEMLPKQKYKIFTQGEGIVI